MATGFPTTMSSGGGSQFVAGSTADSNFTGNMTAASVAGNAAMRNAAGGIATGRYLVNKTANYTIATTDNGTWFTNSGATALITLQLPTAPVIGFRIGAICCMTVANGIALRAGTNEKIMLAHTSTATAGAISQTGSGRPFGEVIEITYIGTNNSQSVGCWWFTGGYGFDWSAIA